MEMVYRGLYHFTAAYLAAQTVVGIFKRKSRERARLHQWPNGVLADLQRLVGMALPATTAAPSYVLPSA